MALDPDTPVLLTTALTEFEAETISQALIADGIPARVFGTTARVLQWELGAHDAIQVVVRRADLQRAGDVLKAIRAESVDIDWSEVEREAGGTGEPSDPPAAAGAATARRTGPTVFMLLLLLASLFGAIAIWEPGMPGWFFDSGPGPNAEVQWVCGGIVCGNGGSCNRSTSPEVPPASR